MVPWWKEQVEVDEGVHLKSSMVGNRAGGASMGNPWPNDHHHQSSEKPFSRKSDLTAKHAG